MRTQLIESVVIGTVIGGIVLIARWISPEQSLIQLGIILIGAIVLMVIQRFLVRKEVNPMHLPVNEPPQPDASVPIATPPSMLHSPHLGWAEGGESDSADEEETAVQQATGLGELEPRADDSQEKVV